MKLQEVSSNRTTLTKSNCTTPHKETEKSLEYLSNEYDDQKRLSLSTKQQISRLSTRLTEIATKVDSLSIAIDQAQQYSYAYNIKLMGVPELKPKESAIETSQLCEQIFKAMGVNASILVIDIAHRVATRNPNSNQAKPIRLQIRATPYTRTSDDKKNERCAKLTQLVLVCLKRHLCRMLLYLII